MTTINNTIKLQVVAWNLAFGARKSGFLEEIVRAEAIRSKLVELDPNAVLGQELAIRQYRDGRRISLPDLLGVRGSRGHFQPALDLGGSNSFPYGKLATLYEKYGILAQQQGPGLWFPLSGATESLELANLYSADAANPLVRPVVEIIRPLTHGLYMPEAPDSATAAMKDRPALWARFHRPDIPADLKAFICAVHLPTFSDEEKDPAPTQLNATQQQIAKHLLHWESDADGTIVDPELNTVADFASAVRLALLQQLIAQMNRLATWWGPSPCVFILGGDFNFLHGTGAAEEQYLREAGFLCAKTSGSTRIVDERHGPRIVDNLWVRGAAVSESLFEGKQIEDTRWGKEKLPRISDHYPVVATVNIDLSQ